MAAPGSHAPAKEIYSVTPKSKEIGNLFEVQKALGRGSYGTVFRAKRLTDGQKYALKEADVGKMGAIERRDAVNEIRLMASIQHENVVRYYEAIIDGDHLTIVMEYAPNGDLSRFIRKGAELGKAFPEKMIWRYLQQICRGLQCLHRNNIIHRDLKPANIFVGADDVVKIGDLGIAKLVKDGLARTQIGTPHYMSATHVELPPELWLNRPYTFTSDLWAVGCLLYELMTYRVPFEAKSMAELRSKVMAGTFKPVRAGKYSAELINLMQSLLQISPSKRTPLDRILAMPVMQEHTGNADAAGYARVAKQSVLKTIRVPEDLELLPARLPPAAYPEIDKEAQRRSPRF